VFRAPAGSISIGPSASISGNGVRGKGAPSSHTAPNFDVNAGRDHDFWRASPAFFKIRNAPFRRGDCPGELRVAAIARDHGTRAYARGTEQLPEWCRI
jgi:hypothetical protein